MKFRKRPVIVEADQFFRTGRESLPFQNDGAPLQFGCSCGENAACSLCDQFWIQTLEGPLKVSDGDWIIKGVAGEFYPCKPDIFVRTYEPMRDVDHDTEYKS